ASEPRGTPPEEGDAPVRLRAPGEPPSPAEPPPGCPFHPRCPSAEPICRESLPREEAVEGTEHSYRCYVPLGGG
ncbi:MAG: oligopeptide/dipeptide ABC transporter ATP-binding protein, partial [Acidithiobacillales bacterium]